MADSKVVTTLKQTNRNFEVVGTLLEMNLELETDRTITLNNGTKVKGTAIHGEFGKPDMLVEVNGEPIPVKLMWTNSINKDGKPNTKNYKAMETIMNEYTPKTKATAEKPANRVKITGMVGLNEYGKDDDWKSHFELTGMNCTRNVKDDGKDVAYAKLISGVIKKVVPETMKKGDDVEETGRKIISFYIFDKTGKLLPLSIYVPEDLVDGFDGQDYKNGDTVDFDVDIATKTIGGGKKVAKSGFGKAKDNITNSFTIQEMVLTYGSDAFEDDDVNKYDLKLVKIAEGERVTLVENGIKEAKEKKANGGGYTTTTSKSKGLGKPKDIKPSVGEDLDDEDSLPF